MRGVHGAEGLVHEQHGRIRREAPGHADALLLSAGELARETVSVDRRVQADEVEQFVHAVGDAPAVPREQARHQADVLGDGQVGHHAAALHDVADLTAQPGGVTACDVFPADQDPPGGGLDEAVDHLQRGGLAAAGRTDEHHRLPRGDDEVQGVHGGTVLPRIELRQGLETDLGPGVTVGAHARSPFEMVSRPSSTSSPSRTRATTTMPRVPTRA